MRESWLWGCHAIPLKSDHGFLQIRQRSWGFGGVKNLEKLEAKGSIVEGDSLMVTDWAKAVATHGD